VSSICTLLRTLAVPPTFVLPSTSNPPAPPLLPSVAAPLVNALAVDLANYTLLAELFPLGVPGVLIAFDNSTEGRIFSSSTDRHGDL